MSPNVNIKLINCHLNISNLLKESFTQKRKEKKKPLKEWHVELLNDYIEPSAFWHDFLYCDIKHVLLYKKLLYNCIFFPK